jgi:hypothetical protein
VRSALWGVRKELKKKENRKIYVFRKDNFLGEQLKKSFHLSHTTKYFFCGRNSKSNSEYSEKQLKLKIHVRE